jgi:hypothetical protein
MNRRRVGGWLISAGLVVFAAFVLPPIEISIQPAPPRPPQSSLDNDLANAPPRDETKAAACAQTVTEFIPALDEVMSREPESSHEYRAILATYLFYDNGDRRLSTPNPSAPISGCDIKQVIEIAKRSRFFYKINRAAVGSPIVEFRNKSAKV